MKKDMDSGMVHGAGAMPKGKMKEMERSGDRERSGPKQQDGPGGVPGGRGGSPAGDRHIGGSHLRGAVAHCKRS